MCNDASSEGCPAIAVKIGWCRLLIDANCPDRIRLESDTILELKVELCSFVCLKSQLLHPVKGAPQKQFLYLLSRERKHVVHR